MAGVFVVRADFCRSSIAFIDGLKFATSFRALPVVHHRRKRSLCTSAIRARQDPATATSQASRRRPRKLYDSADDAVADLKDGMTILSAGFGLCGVAETVIDAIRKKGIKDLTVVSNNAGAHEYGLAKLSATGQISRMISSFIGTNKPLVKQYLSGEVSVELCPQGSIAERLRAGGAGVPAFYTATGMHTYIQTGQIPIRLGPKDPETGKQAVIEPGKPRETRIFDGKQYCMETAIKGDVAILRAWKVDEAGNCVFRTTTKNYGNVMAKAAQIAIVEAEHIVPVGTFAPEEVDLPSVFIDRIVPATSPKQIEKLQLLDANEGGSDKISAWTADEGEGVKRQRIARRTAKEFKEGFYVNLGVGIPTLSTSYLDPDMEIWLQSENGIVGMGPYPRTKEEADPDTVNAGKEPVKLVPGASTFDSAESFAMIRGGHVDVTVLGALQVSANGDLANYMIPGKVFNGMGGAMDLVSNPEQTKVVVVTTHIDKHGRSKIVQNCDLPLTGKSCVSTIITELCVFEVDRSGGGGLLLTEVAEGVSVEDVKERTEAQFAVAENLGTM